MTVVSQPADVRPGDTRLADALKNVPGITLNAGEGAARGDTVNLRGFSAFNDFFLDGIRDAAVYNRDTFDLQTVEVLKGPAATLFGRGSTGGAINQVTKAPTLGAFDRHRRYREQRRVPRRDRPRPPARRDRRRALQRHRRDLERRRPRFVRSRRWGVAPTATFGIGHPTTVTLAYLHLSEDDRPDWSRAGRGDQRP